MSAFVSILILGPAFALFIAGIAQGENAALLGGLIAGGILALIVGLIIILAFQAFWQVFTYAAWHFGFEVVTAEAKAAK